MLDELEDLGPPVHAVRGNVDSAQLQARLPLVRTVVADGGVRIAMLHDAGPPGGAWRGCAAASPTPPRWSSATPTSRCTSPRRDFTIFNPGSPTERRRAPRHTMGMAVVAHGRVAFELIELD